jgi:hypothetical protein
MLSIVGVFEREAIQLLAKEARSGHPVAHKIISGILPGKQPEQAASACT